MAIRRITSGDELGQRNGLAGLQGRANDGSLTTGALFLRLSLLPPGRPST